MLKIIEPVSLVDISIGTYVDSFTMALSVQVRPIIGGTIRPFVNTVPGPGIL